MDQSTEREWRCRQCGTLIGVERYGRMHLKYRSAQFIVTGAVTAVCRRCSEINEVVVGAEASPTGNAVGA
jgi:phage FluMu protein Com